MSPNSWRVRLLEAADVLRIAAYWHDPAQQADHAARGSDLTKLLPPAELAAVYAGEIGQDLRTASRVTFVIEWGGEPVANVSVMNLNTQRDTQVHCHVWRPEQRRRGIGSAVLHDVLQTIFNTCPVTTLVFEPSRHNLPINRLVQKCGFRPVKTYRTQPSPMTRVMEVHRYEITREALRQAQAACPDAG
ncbi:MAG: GNAT family N-acetyltransferase [Deltaproteobacteria bacterium]|nr:GNAT family N-acetyltransferase [Deltaproteobacteria bacterium]